MPPVCPNSILVFFRTDCTANESGLAWGERSRLMFKNIDDPWAYSVMMLVVFGAIAFAHLASEKTTAWKNEREEKARKEKARAKAGQKKTQADTFYDDFPGDD
jgi:hypothetical protein